MYSKWIAMASLKERFTALGQVKDDSKVDKVLRDQGGQTIFLGILAIIIYSVTNFR